MRTIELIDCPSGRLVQGEIHRHRIIGKDHAPAVGAIKHTHNEKRLHVAMHGLHVAVKAAGKGVVHL